MALKLRNRKFYSVAFAGSVIAAAVVWYSVFGLHRGSLLLPAITAIAAFFYFWYKHHLDETRLFKELFTEFNRRYDKLNNRLNDIVSSDNSVELKQSERNTVFDYFNLCAEEHFFYRAHYIDDAVWKSWRHGMAFFFNNPRIRDLWDQECGSPDERASYYGFEPPIYEWAPVPSHNPLASERRYVQATWQSAVDRTEPRSIEFSVSEYFAHAPQRSVTWAQQFVDMALSYRDVRAFHNDSGIGFDPNFVFIERIYTEYEGFVASFYGSVDKFQGFGHELEPGRTPASWSRLKVRSEELLERAIKCLHISANLKDLDRV